MYELNGHMYSVEEVQAAADKDQLSLEEYIGKHGLKQGQNEEPKKDQSNHISKADFDANYGDDVEENLFKKLKNKYSEEDGISFSQSRPGRDQITATNEITGESKDFYLKSDYNTSRDLTDAMRRDGAGITPEYSSYEDFISFIDTSKSSTDNDQKYNYKKSAIGPKDYIKYEEEGVGDEMVYNAKFDKMVPTGKTNKKLTQVDAKQQKEITDIAATEIAKVFHDLTTVGGADHPYSASTQVTPELDHKIHEHVIEKLRETTGLNITMDSYNLMVNRGEYTKGFAEKIRQDVDNHKSNEQYVERKSGEGYTKDEQNLYKNETDAWTKKKGEKFAKKKELNIEINKKQTTIDNLKSSIEKGEVDEVAGADQILSLEREIDVLERNIKDLATTTRRVKVAGDAMDVKFGTAIYEDQDFVNEELGSLAITDGLLDANKKRVEDSYQTTKSSINAQIQNEIESGRAKNDYEALKYLQEDSYVEYNNILKLGGNKRFSLNFSDYNNNVIITKSGTTNKYDPFLDKIKSDPRFTINKDGSVKTTGGKDLSYNDLHSLGLSGRSFDGFLDPLKNKLSDEDKEWMRVHEETLDTEEGIRYGLYELADLNIDPAKIKKKNAVQTFAVSAGKQMLVEWGGYSEHDADKAMASSNFTKRYTLDKLNELAPVFNEVLKEEIKEGKINPLTFTKEQADNMERTLTENVAEGVGHMVPTLVKLAGISAVSGGVLNLTGASKVLRAWQQAGGLYNKLKLHGSMLLLEEAKMMTAGFKPTSGAAFYAGGVLTKGITPFKTRFKYLDPLWQKVVKGGPVGAASMELASVTELFYEDLMGDKDFKSNFNAMFGDLDEVEQRLITNSLMFSIIGANHVKKMDFYSTGGKYKLYGKLEKKKLEILGQGKKGANKKYENLSQAEKSKYDGFTEAQAVLQNQIRIETMVKTLDPYGGKTKLEFEKLEKPAQDKITTKFEKEFKQRFIDPFNSAIGKAVNNKNYTWKPTNVKFVKDGKNFDNKGATAEYNKEANEIMIDVSQYKPGKEVHEFVHAAFKAMVDAQGSQGIMKFGKRMSEVFKDYDKELFMPGSGVKMSEVIDVAMRNRQGRSKDGRTKEGKEVRGEEFIAYMAEFLADPAIYYNTVSTSMAKDIKLELTDMFSETFGYSPKIKSPKQLVELLGMLSQSARRGTAFEVKAEQLAKLDQIKFLDLEVQQYSSRTKNKESNMTSVDLAAMKNRLLERNIKLAKDKPEGWRDQNKSIATEIKRINNLIETSEINDINAKKYKESIDAREKLFEEKPELKDRNVRDPKIERAASELREANMGALTEFVQEGFKDVPGSKITRADFKSYVESVEFNKILNSYYKEKTKTVEGVETTTPSAFGRGVPFGAYLRNSLFGQGYVMGRGNPQRQGNVLRALQGGKSQDQSIRTVSMFDAEGKVRADILELSTGESVVLDGGTSPSGSVGKGQADAGLINVKQKFNLTDKHVKSIESKIDLKKLESMDYAELLDLRPDLTLEMFGGRTDVVFRESNKNIKEKAQYIADKFETIYDILPEGAMIGFGQGAKAKAKEGKSTNIEPMLLDGRIYEAGSRTGAGAKASFAKTGSAAGLPVQTKLKLTKEQFLEKFGVFLMPDGKTVDFTKTKIKSQSKSLRAIDALIAETGRSITNQVARRYLEKNYEVNPELAQELSVDALLHQLSVGKSKSLASQNLYDVFTAAGKKPQDIGRDLRMYMKNRELLLKSDPTSYGAIKDFVETKARIFAEEGKAAEQFMKALKSTKYDKMLGGTIYETPGDALYKMSDAKFKESDVAQARFERLAFDLAGFIPSVDMLKQSGNTKLLLDMFVGHYNIVGSDNAKVEGDFKVGIKQRLSKEPGEFKPSKELIERFKNFNWELAKSVYASKNYTGYKKIMKASTLAEQRAIAKEYFGTKEGKLQAELYDMFNSGLQEWLYSSKEGTPEFKQKADYILKIKKANSSVGTTGERVLSPVGYLFLPGKAFEGTVKYEHLKSSSQQSFESAQLILDGSYIQKGKKTLASYKGIFGMLGDFNMIDKATGKVNSSNIFRFAENLELAKNIYKNDGKFEKSLYQEIVEKVGRQEVKKLEKIITSQKYDKALENGRDQKKPKKGISVFDFDDTLARTNSQIRVTMPNGKKFKINATEFAKRDAELTKQGAKYDFSEFNKVVDGKKGPLFDLAMKRQGKFGNKDIFVLTARPKESALAIHKFLKGIGLEVPMKNITGLADGRPEAKADWIIKKAAEGFNDFYFADDAIKNVKAVKSALTQLDVKSDVQQALASIDLNADFNKILENKTGIGANKVYSKAKGQVAGANKGRFKFFIPPTAEDFVGLIYPTLGKGKVGDSQMAWYKKHLLDPFARGENAITKERHQMMKDFRALKNEIKDVPKNLRDKIKEGPAAGYTKEQAMRVYIWNKQGVEVPGVSKTDLKQLNGFVKSNESLRTFADRLIMIHKGDGYQKPGQNWLAGTITTDMIEGLNGTKRAKHLKQWKQNRDIIFSEANLNKYEAAYGSKARQAMENILGRMESGNNRKKLGGAFQRLENEILDWTNNSVGAIMFLNSRSAVLQTISAINYVNFKDNNPLAAAKAFGNQKQYWADFNKLFNSDYLVQRRDGLKININEAEIVEMAATSKNKAKAAISYLLNKGFVMTRGADSFAIASGGASFYRNRVNTYKKQGLSEKKAEELAFKDFREISEESQQSSRTDRISAQQASGLGRVVLAFANTPMQYARLQKRAIQDLANGRGDAKTNLSKITYYGFVQNLIFNGLQQAMFAIGFDENEENEQQIMDKSGRIINGMLDSQLRGLGYGGAAVSTVKNILHKISEEHGKDRPKYEKAAWEMLDFSPPISSKVTKVRSALRSLDYDLEDMKSKGFSLENPAYMAGAQVLSAGANIPADRVLRKMKNIQDAMDEDNEMWAKVALLSGWTEWELGISDFQKGNAKKSNKKSSSSSKRIY